MSKLSLREIAQSQLDSTPVIDGQLIVCLDTGNAYRDTATAHVKIGSDLEVVSDLPLAPLAEKLYYLKPDKLYVFLGGNWTLLNDKTIDLDKAIAKLPAGSSTSLNDDVEIIAQDTDITQPHYYRRKLVVLWEYIKTKAQDFFAAKNHKHEKADITDFPTSMPASDVYPWAKAATKPSYTKAEIGLGKVDNTADADKTVKRATTAGTADSANSVTWENVKNKPTAFPVEAHTHDDRYYTEAEVDGKLNEKLHEASYQGDLNDLTTTGLYHLYGTNTNVPANGNATVYVDFNVGTPYQVWTYDMDGTTYRRTRSSGAWTSWTQLSFTDTKDWASITGKPSTFPPEAHTHDDRYYTEAEVDGKLGSKVDNTEAGANGLINKLESGTAVPVDNDLIVTQWANHTTATTADQNRYVRRPMSSIWSYIKSKADSVYQPKGSYAASGHTHTKDQVGLGNVDNTADKDKNVSTARGISVGDPVLATGAECSEITGKINDNKSLGTTAANAGVWGLRNALDFRWYDTHWQIGNLRSGSTPSAGFGFAFKDEGENSFSLKARILTDGTYEGNISGNAATAGTANTLSGFSPRSSQTWGVQTGTFIHGEGEGTGGDFAFRRDCPNAGQLSMVLDGRFYQNEGKYMCLDTNNYSSYALPLTGGTLSGALHIKQPNSGNYNENIRMHPSSSNWTAIVMCGDDNTGDSGTSAKTWGIFTFNGEISIAKNGTSINGSSSNASLTCKSDNVWRANEVPILTTDNGIPKSGGTMSGALNFANGTWNLVGDDAYMGDHNIGGSFCIMGANDTTRLALVNKDNQGDYALVEYGGGNLNFNKKLGANITGHADGDLSLSGGTMNNGATINFADSGTWTAGNGTYPRDCGGLQWTGQSDSVHLYAEETGGDNLELVMQFGDDNSNGLSIRNNVGGQTSRIDASGNATFNSSVTAGTYYTSNWYRARGQSGFYFEDYGGGWYMIDDTWIRAYNNKNIYTPGVIQCDSGFNGNLNGNATTSTLVRHQGNVTAISGTATRTAGLQLYGAYDNGYPMTYGNVICASNGAFGSEIALDCVGGDGKQGPGRMYYRNRSDWGTSKWSDWATVAYLTDKVAGANHADSADSATNASYLNFTPGNEINFNGTPINNTVYVGYRNTSINEYKFNNGDSGGGLAQVTASQFNGSLNGTATNAEYLSNDSAYMRMHWNGQSGQPTWLWGGNDASNMYVWNPSNFSVNYANSSGYANSAGNGIYSSDINIWGNEGYIRFKDGIQICWGTSTSGSASGSFTFPQRFVYQPCIMISGTGAYRYAFYVTKSENTGFKYYRDGSGTSASPQYVAIGNWDNSSL